MHDDIGIFLEFGHIGFGQVPKDVDLTGGDEGLTHLSAGDDAHNDLIRLGLIGVIPIVFIFDQGDVVARDPFFEHEGTGAQKPGGVVIPRGHVGGAFGGVLGQHRIE